MFTAINLILLYTGTQLHGTMHGNVHITIKVVWMVIHAFIQNLIWANVAKNTTR